MFVRDDSRPGHPVIDEWKPECLWVHAGDGMATVKMDGTNVKVEHGRLLKRQKPKDRDYDNAAYVPCHRDNPSDRWAWEAFDATTHDDGIFELVGPKIQGNVHGFSTHHLIRVVPPSDRLIISEPIERTFTGLREYLTMNAIEGVVFHHPDGRLAKIKRRDFGLPWPPK